MSEERRSAQQDPRDPQDRYSNPHSLLFHDQMRAMEAKIAGLTEEVVRVNSDKTAAQNAHRIVEEEFNEATGVLDAAEAPEFDNDGQELSLHERIEWLQADRDALMKQAADSTRLQSEIEVLREDAKKREDTIAEMARRINDQATTISMSTEKIAVQQMQRRIDALTVSNNELNKNLQYWYDQAEKARMQIPEEGAENDDMIRIRIAGYDHALRLYKESGATLERPQEVWVVHDGIMPAKCLGFEVALRVFWDAVNAVREYVTDKRVRELGR